MRRSDWQKLRSIRTMRRPLRAVSIDPIGRSSISRAGYGNNSQSGSKDVRKCYICNKLGHVAKYYKVSNKEREARGSLHKSDEKARFSHSQHESKASVANKQVSTAPLKAAQSKPPSNSVRVDPVSLLYSSDSESSVDMVRVDDQGSRPQYVNIENQGVIDTGADITIMGGELS